MKMPLPIPMTLDLTPDWRALVFTFALHDALPIYEDAAADSHDARPDPRLAGLGVHLCTDRFDRPRVRTGAGLASNAHRPGERTQGRRPGPLTQIWRAELAQCPGVLPDGRFAHIAPVDRIPGARHTEHGGGAGRVRSQEPLPDLSGPGARRIFRGARGGLLRQAATAGEDAARRDLRLPDRYAAGGHRQR